MNAGTETTTEAIPFEYIDLNEVDPSFSAIDEGVYTVQILKADLPTYTYKQGAKAGQTFQMVKFNLGITKSDKFAGRRLFEGLFLGTFEVKALRRLMDATGIAQFPGSPLTDWLQALSTEQPEFKTRILKVPVDERGNAIRPNAKNPATAKVDAKGNPVMGNMVDWKEILPAD